METDLKQRQQLTKDLLEVCEQDKELLEVIMDDYVYRLNDKEVRDYKDICNIELGEDWC